jgi:formamidopyrimidine-DNA glycosylase
MPELPEVEYIARQLRAELVGRRITGVEVSWARSLGGADPADIAAAVVGRSIIGIGRRAKYLLIYLDDGEVLTVHRRMSGNLVLAPPAEPDQWVRVAFDLDDGRRLLFTDPRKFGRLAVVPRDALDAYFAAIGPEPLEPEFTPEALAERLAGTKRPIKAALLDQSVVAGLGNIYADEALYHAGIHPLRPAASLTSEEIGRLRDAIRAVLETAITYGGTTIGRHRDVYDEAGTNVEHLLVYRRTGKPCPQCGTPIERIVVGQRGTHFCPTCQPLHIA